jgi:hypothetical protein
MYLTKEEKKKSSHNTEERTNTGKTEAQMHYSLSELALNRTS